MLKIDVQNFRGIRSAALMCAPIALVCGRNEQGKSSIVDAVRATVMGDPQPYGLKKDDLPGKLVFRGQTNAAVRLMDEDEGRETSMTWPAGDVETTGAPFRATPVAAGMVRFTGLNDRDRAKMLAEYLKTNPEADEFLEATRKCGLDPGTLDAVWQVVKQQGWDTAWEKFKTEATKQKGAWEAITGDRYGTKVGTTWRPKGWGPDHEALTDSDIAEDILASREAVEAAIGTVAINEGEKKRLEGLAANIPKLQQLLKTRETDGKQAKAALEQAERDLQAIPVLEPDNWPKCPHCQKAVAVRAGQKGQTVLEIPKKALDEKERDKLKNQTEDAQRVFDEARQKYDEARNTYEVCSKDLRVAQDSKAQLEQSNPDAPKVNIDELRADLKRAEGFAAAKVKIRDAVKKHSEIIARLAVVEVLAPEGLRQTKLTEKLGQFNESLASLCEVASWGPVVIGPDLGVTLNGYRYALCATSGQMRIDVTLQCALAMRDGSELLLVDDADQLDAKGRNGLFALLGHTEKYALVGMMLLKSGQAPDLAAADAGRSYWIDDAQAYDLTEYKAAHAA